MLHAGPKALDVLYFKSHSKRKREQEERERCRILYREREAKHEALEI